MVARARRFFPRHPRVRARRLAAALLPFFTRMPATLDHLKRSGTPTSSPSSPRRIPAWLVPALVLAGFALVFAAVFRDRLIPAREVEVARVLAVPAASADADADARDSGDAAAGDPSGEPSGPGLFQASGWIEPDPYPVKATALIDGVVERVHVLEGERVERGQLLATLIDEDTGLRLENARSELARHDADILAHCAGILAVVEELRADQARRVSAAAARDAARDLIDRYRRTDAGAISERDLTDARLELARVEPMVEAAAARVREIEHRLIQMTHETTSMQRRREAYETAVAEAELAHSRTRVHAPVDGRILRLHAMPGQKRMLGMDDPDSSTIASIYDPEKLQVRVDVPLADAAGLRPGQPAVVRSNLLPDRRFQGRVTRIVGEADLTRNTLQAKVEIDRPDDALRPEMICRVEFFEARADDSGRPAGGGSGRIALWVPEPALEGDAVWVVDPDSSRVRRRELELGRESRDGHRRVRSGLNPGERVVLRPRNLRADQRVRPTS